MNEINSTPGQFTDAFAQALVYATKLHNNQSRKATEIPYIAHLLAVTALVIEWGGDEDQAIAALLHDSVEDQGGMERLQDVRTRFGEPGARIVEACSDSFVIPKPPWRERKEAYLRKLLRHSDEARLISLADKLHNARSIYFDLLVHGDSIMDRFRGGKEGTLWYYRALVTVFRETDPENVMVDELARVVAGIEQLVGS